MLRRGGGGHRSMLIMVNVLCNLFLQLHHPIDLVYRQQAFLNLTFVRCQVPQTPRLHKRQYTPFPYPLRSQAPGKLTPSLLNSVLVVLLQRRRMSPRLHQNLQTRPACFTLVGGTLIRFFKQPTYGEEPVLFRLNRSFTSRRNLRS